MAYEPRYERFEATGPKGLAHIVEFRKAGVLSRGDRPELYFFEVDGRQAVIAMSGTALNELQSTKRYLSREEKIDVAGLALRKQIEAGEQLEAEEMYLRGEELLKLAGELGLEW